jgi:hypothetical protein
MELGRPPLENGRRVEAPGFFGQPPGGGPADRRLNVQEIGLEIGAKKKAGALPCLCRDSFQKWWRQDSVLVVPSFGPGIWKKNIEPGEANRRRQRRQKIGGIGQHEMNVGEPGTFAFTFGPSDSIPASIDADAELAGMVLGIGRKKVAMAATDFPDKCRGRTEDLSAMVPQGLAAAVGASMMLGGALGGFHGVLRLCNLGSSPCPARFDQNH